MGIGKAVGTVVLGAVVFAAGYMYGPNLEYVLRGVPKEQQCRVVYSGRNQTLEASLEQGGRKTTFENFAIRTVYSLPTRQQQVVATEIVSRSFTSNDKKGLVYNVLGQLTPDDRREIRKAEIGNIIDEMASYINPFGKKKEGLPKNEQ